jgi:two-component system chemotaxis response regulator CheB
MIRIVIASTSADCRSAIADALGADPALAIIAETGDGDAAFDQVRRLRPDIVLMDAVLPKVDGCATTKRIMIECPTPIVILSGGKNAREVALAFHALRAGALSVSLPPPPPGTQDAEAVRAEFVALVTAMAQVRVVRRWKDRQAEEAPRQPHEPGPRRRIIAIAASTGGPAALHRILADLPGDFPVPILIVQHMTSGFIGGFAAWLDTLTALKVKVAAHGEALCPHTAYLAADECHLGLAPDGTIALSREPPLHGIRPSADFLLHSVARVFGSAVVAVILTGMGQDGIEGLRTVRNGGGRIFVQDEASSVVFGMPRAALEAGLADGVLPLAAIAPHLIRVTCGQGDQKW